MKAILLLTMIFCHILDDYRLQGILSSLKQKSWWKENYPDDLYRHDYIAALITHSFSWTFMVQLPVMVLMVYRENVATAPFLLVFVANMLIHAAVDHKKANLRTINLIADQSIHLIQVLITWAIFVYVMPVI